MSGFVLFATPWWVNLLILIPCVPWLLSRKEKIGLARKRLLIAALFAVAFGFVEAAVVVYLRAATGLLANPSTKMLVIPASLLAIERVREAATMIMLAALAWLVGQTVKQQVIVFLWAFAFWDAFYYVWLRLAIGWPGSLTTPDVLFLLPVPWIAQVWFPILVSSLTAVAIWLRSSRLPA